MLLLLDACSMQLVPASAAAVARDFCCCCLLFDVWVALFFVVIVVCAVLIASISAILGVLQNGKHLQAQRERGLGPISLNPLPLVANRNAEQTKGCNQPTNKTQQNTQSRMTCIPYPWQIETKWLSEVWVRPVLPLCFLPLLLMPSPSLSFLLPSSPSPSSPSPSPSARWFRVSFSFLRVLRVLQKGGEHLLTEPKRKHSFTAHNFLQSDQQNAKGIILNPCQGSSDSNLSWWMLESMHFSKAPCQTSDRRSQSRRTVWRTTKSFGPFGHMTRRSLPRNLGSLSPCNWKNPPVPKVQGVSLRAISNLWYSFSWGEPFIALESPSWGFLKSDFSANLVQLEPNMW